MCIGIALRCTGSSNKSSSSSSCLSGFGSNSSSDIDSLRVDCSSRSMSTLSAIEWPRAMPPSFKFSGKAAAGDAVDTEVLDAVDSVRFHKEASDEVRLTSTIFDAVRLSAELIVRKKLASEAVDISEAERTMAPPSELHVLSSPGPLSTRVSSISPGVSIVSPDGSSLIEQDDDTTEGTGLNPASTPDTLVCENWSLSFNLSSSPSLHTGGSERDEERTTPSPLPTRDMVADGDDPTLNSIGDTAMPVMPAVAFAIALAFMPVNVCGSC
mmetsp:Transcript_54463/g.127365  ORF Transcript_54463/g.127365 Transcript_54463/m.127365 type:complete len:269 (+) Transcript_54463:71-877(+)